MFRSFRNLRLSRPLAFLDLETTGTNPAQDRIVELAILRVEPQGNPITFAKRLNPGMPIPPSASAVHGITDADVAHCPSFAEVSGKIQRMLDGADLSGFNIKRFDLPVLIAEFNRSGGKFRLNGRAIVDIKEIFHRLQPRDLKTAVREYLGRTLDGAHSATADAMAAAAVLDAMLPRHRDLPRSVAGLHREFRSPDLAGRFRLENGALVFGFGKYAGYPLAEVAQADEDYLRWMIQADFFDDVKALVQRALAGTPCAGQRPSPAT